MSKNEEFLILQRSMKKIEPHYMAIPRCVPDGEAFKQFIGYCTL